MPCVTRLSMPELVSLGRRHAARFAFRMFLRQNACAPGNKKVLGRIEY